MKKLLILSVLLIVSIQGIIVSSTPASATDDGMILRWNFEESSGTAVSDSSGHTNPGTIINGGTRVAAHDGNGVQLDGVNDYIQSASPQTSLGTVNRPYALSTWVKIDSGVTQGNIVDISSNLNGGGWCIPFLRLQDGKFQATGWNNNQPTSAVDDTPVVANQWYQVLTSWDPTNGLRLFVDGELVDSTPQAGFQAYGSGVYYFLGMSNVGCSSDQGFLKGTVDDARLYDRALTNNDISDIQDGVDTQETTTTLVPTTTTTIAPTTTTPDVTDGPNNGDGNNDNIPDVTQPNVTTIKNTVMNTPTGYVVLATPSNCLNKSVMIKTKAEAKVSDEYLYPAGLLDFTIDCGSPGSKVAVEQYYYGITFKAKDFVGRKYFASDGTTRTLDGALVSDLTIGGQHVVKLVYSLADGSSLDDDGMVNGIIVDPSGLATTSSLPATGTNSMNILIPSFVILIFGCGLIIVARKRRQTIK